MSENSIHTNENSLPVSDTSFRVNISPDSPLFREGESSREILISPMTEHDYDDVRALWMTIRGFGIRALDDSREDVKRFLDRNPTTSVVARDGDRVVGSILCGSDGRQGALYHVCVAKKYRRLGIGTQMVAYCMRRLKDMGINRVTLIAFKHNDEGNAFWNQIGWKRRSDVNYYEFILNEKNITRFIGVEEA